MLQITKKYLYLAILCVTLAPLSACGQTGKLPTFKPPKFLKAFRGISEATREAELELASASRRHPELAETLERAVGFDLRRKRLVRSTLLAMELLCKLERPGLLEKQLQFARSEHTPIAVVASSTLADRTEPAAFEPLTNLAERPEYLQSFGMRRAILDGVANYKQPEAIDFLISAHEKHPGQLRFEATRHLMRLTGENHGGYTGEWQEWWDENRSGFEFANVVPRKDEKDIPWPEPVPRLFEVPIYAYRVMFVVDRSRSMLSTKGDVTRMEEVQKEFERVLKDLRPEAMFNVISYSKNLKLWQKKLVPATLENRLAAIKHVWSLRPDTSTSFYNAVDRALKDAKELEMIVVLSDGKPTAGSIVEPRQIVKVLTKKNKFHEVSITALGLDLQPEQREFLKKLTDKNFGELWEIR